MASGHDGLTEAPTLEGGDTGPVIGVRGTPVDGRVVEPAGAVGTSTCEGTGPTLAGKVIGGWLIGKMAGGSATFIVAIPGGNVTAPVIGAVNGVTILAGSTPTGKVIGGWLIGKPAPSRATVMVVTVTANFGKMIGSPGAVGNAKGVSGDSAKFVGVGS